MNKLLTIAVNTFRETLRQPIFYVLLLATFGVLVLGVSLSGWTIGSDSLQHEDTRMMTELGLSTLLVTGLFISAFAASGSLAREIETRTVLTVVSKPVGRPVVLLGKFLGVLAASTVAYYLASLVFLWTVRHGSMPTSNDTYDTVVLTFGLSAFALAMLGAMFCNYFFGWQFTSTSVALMLVLFTAASVLIGFIGKGWTAIAFGEGIEPQAPVVIALLWMAVTVIAALAVAVSTRLGQLATLGVCIGFFLLSLVSDALFLPHVEGNFVAKVAYWVAPNLNQFFLQDVLAQHNRHVGSMHVLLAGGYAACYSAAMLLIGVALFQTREMDARETASGAPGLVNAFAWTLRGAAAAVAIFALILLAGEPDRVTVLWAAAAGAIALGGWLLAGYLGAGVRWAFWLLLFLAASQWVFSAIYLLWLRRDLASDLRVTGLIASTLLAAYVALMALRRATRDHFALRRRPAL